MIVVLLLLGVADVFHTVEGRPRRILLDTDVDTDDFFAFLYLLKLNRSEFQLEVSFFPFFFFVIIFTILCSEICLFEKLFGVNFSKL